MQLDEDQAELRLFQEKYLEASDRHTDYKRTKQFRRAVLPIQMPGSVKVRKCYPSNAGQRMVASNAAEHMKIGTLVPGCLEERDQMLLKHPEGSRIWSKSQLQMKNLHKIKKKTKGIISR